MKGTKYYSNKQENTIASYLGWSVVTGSGSRSTLPGDIQSDEWLGECKTHETAGHKIIFYHSVWNKLQDEAISKYKFPALFVDDGSQKVENTWVMYSGEFPSGEYRSIAYPFANTANIGFKSLDMWAERNKYDSTVPVIFLVGLLGTKSQLCISSLKDFMVMFGSSF